MITRIISWLSATGAQPPLETQRIFKSLSPQLQISTRFVNTSSSLEGCTGDSFTSPLSFLGLELRSSSSLLRQHLRVCVLLCVLDEGAQVDVASEVEPSLSLVLTLRNLPSSSSTRGSEQKSANYGGLGRGGRRCLLAANRQTTVQAGQGSPDALAGSHLVFTGTLMLQILSAVQRANS